jgi:hypothetical protein
LSHTEPPRTDEIVDELENVWIVRLEPDDLFTVESEAAGEIQAVLGEQAHV